MSVNLRIHAFFGWVFPSKDPTFERVEELLYEDNDLQAATSIVCTSEGENTLIVYIEESSIYGTDHPLSGPLFDQSHHRLETDPLWEQRLWALNERLQLGITTAPAWHIGWDLG